MDLGAVIYGIQLWLTVASGEVVIMTLIWRYKLGEWWWSRKPATKEWEFKLSSDGWSLSGRGHNPIQTLTSIFEAWTSPTLRADKQLQKVHDQILLEEIRSYADSEAYRLAVREEAKQFFMTRKEK